VAWIALESSLLTAARYDAKASRLALKFQTGKIYYYLDVPPDIFEALLAAPSAGAFFVSTIRDQFQFVVVRE
jgi:hypothetical protein